MPNSVRRAAFGEPGAPTTNDMTTRRERKRLHTRRRLYEAAVQLFEEQGYDTTTMDEIAELADTARATAYNYFPRKSSFLDEWMHRRREQVSVDLDAQGGEAQPIGALLRSYLDELARINLTQERLTRTLLPAWVRAGGPIDDAPALADVLTRYIRLGQQRGEVREDCDAERAGHLIRNAYLGNLYLWLRDDDSTRLDLLNAVHESVDIVLRGLAPR
jgi:AcrR family transcriptional regulator